MEIKLLTEERQDIVRGLQDLATLVEKEGRSFSDEEKAKYDKDFARQQELESQIDTVKRSNQVKALSNGPEVERLEPAQVKSAARNIEKENLAFRGWVLNNNGASSEVSSSMRQAAYDLGVSLDSSNFMFRQQTIGTVGEGGYLRTPSAYAGLERAMKWYGGIANVCNVVPSANGNPSFWATANDTGNVGAAVDELGTLTNTAVTFSKIDINYKKFGSGVFPVSNELLRDAEVPVSALIEDMVGERLARIINTHTTTGDLTNNKGFMTEATLGKAAAEPDAVLPDELIDLMFSVDPAYRNDPSCHWYMNDATYAYLLKQVDENDERIILPDFTNAGIGRMLGKPILICNAMANIGAGLKPIAYGPASKYVYRPVNGLSFTVLRELYALEDAVGFTAFLSAGARLVQPAAIKYLQNAVS